MAFPRAGSGDEPGRSGPAWEERQKQFLGTHLNNRGYWTMGHNLGKAARSTDKSSSCLLSKVFSLFSLFQVSSLNLRALESVPGMVVLSTGQKMLQLSTPASKFSKATSPSVAHFTATSGLMRTNMKFLRTQPSIEKLGSNQDMENLNLFSLWWSVASWRLTAGPVSPVKRLWALTRSTGEAKSSARQHLGRLFRKCISDMINSASWKLSRLYWVKIC